MVENESANTHGRSRTQMALACVTQQHFMTSNIRGATNLKHLKENIDSIHLHLSEEISKEINEVHTLIPKPAP